MNIDLGINQFPQLKQKLELKIDQKLINKLNLLRMPFQKLLNKLKEESQNNIALEIKENESFIERIKDRYYGGNIRELSVKKEKQIESLSMNIAPTLEEHLLEQLYMKMLGDVDKTIGEELISSLDKDGYIRNYDIIKNKIKKNIKVSGNKIDNVLKIIQSFEPLGVGARDLKECLLIQINEDKISDDIFKARLIKLIKSYSEFIENKDIKSIQNKMGISGEEYNQLFLYIKELDPFPGRQFRKENNNEIIFPSFEIKEDNGKFKAKNLEEEYGPKLKIKEKYLDMLNDPKLDNESKVFIKNKIKDAKQLIEDIKNRKYVIEKLLSIIIQKQDNFLKKGIYWLQPFQQDEAANELKVHASTISRAVRGKYIQTPHGLFPLSFLFPRNQKGFSTLQIKNLIKKTILSNSKYLKSDKEITEILNKDGINIKRRTVAKYRKELNIDPIRGKTSGQAIQLAK